MKVCQQGGRPNSAATARTRSAAGEIQPGACFLASYRTPLTEEIERERTTVNRVRRVSHYFEYFIGRFSLDERAQVATGVAAERKQFPQRHSVAPDV